jgi:hypothetical protein
MNYQLAKDHKLYIFFISQFYSSNQRHVSRRFIKFPQETLFSCQLQVKVCHRM